KIIQERRSDFVDAAHGIFPPSLVPAAPEGVQERAPVIARRPAGATTNPGQCEQPQDWFAPLAMTASALNQQRSASVCPARDGSKVRVLEPLPLSLSSPGRGNAAEAPRGELRAAAQAARSWLNLRPLRRLRRPRDRRGSARR